jgi:hypothetical protein
MNTAWLSPQPKKQMKPQDFTRWTQENQKKKSCDNLVFICVQFLFFSISPYFFLFSLGKSVAKFLILYE